MIKLPKHDNGAPATLCGFTVYLAGRFYDEVFFNSDMSDYEVKQSLINHDGYPPTIRVYKTK